jgi:hypothetical protein
LRYSTPHLVCIGQSTNETTKEQREGRSSRASTVRAAVEASVLLRSVKRKAYKQKLVFEAAVEVKVKILAAVL